MGTRKKTAKKKPATKKKTAKKKPAPKKPAPKKPAPKRKRLAPRKKASPATERRDTIPVPPPDVAITLWHAWPDRPDATAIRDHVEAFFQALHAGDFRQAFTLSPIYAYSDPLIAPADDTAEVERTRAAMLDTLAGYDYVDPSDGAWYLRVTPPSRVEYADLNLSVPDDEGDTLANVFVDDEVTDVTAIFSFLRRDEGWVLAFKMFKVM